MIKQTLIKVEMNRLRGELFERSFDCSSTNFSDNVETIRSKNDKQSRESFLFISGRRTIARSIQGQLELIQERSAFESESGRLAGLTHASVLIETAVTVVQRRSIQFALLQPGDGRRRVELFMSKQFTIGRSRTTGTQEDEIVLNEQTNRQVD